MTPAGEHPLALLFTDVEGSTGLVRRMGAQYVTILADHSAHLRDSFQRHGGEIVDRKSVV